MLSRQRKKLELRLSADRRLPGDRVARPKRWAWEVRQMTLAIHHALRTLERATRRATLFIGRVQTAPCLINNKRQSPKDSRKRHNLSGDQLAAQKQRTFGQ